MKKTSLVSVGWRLLATVIALVPSAAAAQTAASVSWVQGNQGPLGIYASQGVWSQRLIVVKNTSAGDREVKVACLETAGAKGEEVYSRVCMLPAGTVREVELAVRPGQMTSFNQTLTPSKLPGGSDSVQARFAIWDACSGQKLQADFSPVERVHTDQVNVGVFIGDIDPQEFYLYLSHMEPEEPLGNVRIMGSGNSYATRWYGYNAAQVVMLIDADASRMRPSQIEALLDWARRGGVVVLAGGQRLAEALRGELGEAAGVAPVGIHYITKMQVSGLSPKGPVESALGSPLPLVELLPVTAEVIHECNGLPLLTRSAIGEGAIFTLAMPVAGLINKEVQGVWASVHKQLSTLPPVHSDGFFRGEPVRSEVDAFARAVSSQLDGLPPADRQKARSQLEDLRFSAEPGFSVLQSLAGRKAPPRWVPVAVLAAMAAVVAGGGIWLRRRRRGELLWFVLAPASVAVALVIYFVGMSGSKPESLSFVGLVSSAEGGRVRVQEAYSYYSGAQTREVSFSAGCPAGVIVDVGQATSGSASTSETRTDREMLLPDQKIQTNTDKALYVDGMVSGLAFHPEMTFDRQGLAGTIQNDLGFGLSQAVLYVGSRTYRLGDVPQGRRAVTVTSADRLGIVEAVGARQSLGILAEAGRGASASPAASGGRPAARGGRSAPPAPAAPTPPPAGETKWTSGVSAPTVTRGEFTSSLSFDVVDVLRNRLLGCLTTAPTLARPVEDWPVLIGYGAKNILDPLQGASKERVVERKGWNVVAWPVAIQSPPAGTPVTIPSGFARVQYGYFGQETARDLPFSSVIPVRELSLPNAAVVVRAQVPAPLRGLKDATAKLTIRANAKNYRMSVLGRVAATGKETAILAVDRPQGALEVPVASADEFVTSDQAYVFVLRFKSLGGGGEEGLLSGNTFEGVDIDLGGTAR